MALQFIESTPVDVYATVFQVKEHLKSVGWTVLSSSDGTTYNAAGDQITNAGAGAGGMNNSLAWFRIASANGAVEFTVQRASGVSTNWRLKMARSPFAAGTPGATQTPATVDALHEIIITGGGTDAAPSFGSFFWGASAELKGAADDASPQFWFGQYPTLGGNANGAWVLERGSAADPSDIFPYVCYQPGTSNVFYYGSMSSTSPSSSLYTFNPDGGYDQSSSSSAVGALKYSDINPGSLAPDLITGDELNFPIPLGQVASTSADNPCWKGIANLMQWMQTSTPTTGDTETVDTPLDRIVMRSVVLPWKGTVPVGPASTDYPARDIGSTVSFATLGEPGSPATYYLMQANDSVTSALYTWVSSPTPDRTGTGYPGPNSPTNIAISGVL